MAVGHVGDECGHLYDSSKKFVIGYANDSDWKTGETRHKLKTVLEDLMGFVDMRAELLRNQP
ncbi:MAG: hypothetical protein ACKPKO_62985, partial [Candidatus Fonsibacter sp.]